MDDDLRHLDLLGTFYYVVAALLALFGCFPIIHFVVGLGILTGSFEDNGNGPPVWFGLLFAIMALMMILMMWAIAVATWIAGTRLKRHTNYTYCLVIAAILCMFAPVGTVLGVFTIIVLMRPTVKTLFGASTASS
jgi:NADH:ubiquinone oxidoreductase subunit 5 (subunit L)/multisubunit Na+/H+ antiporter MnhA subunit